VTAKAPHRLELDSSSRLILLLRAAALVASLMLLAGCEPTPVQVRALPSPRTEQPAANLPASLHQRNWTGPQRQGSCVHASLTSHLRWLNEFELGEQWRSTYSDGEYASRLMRRLDAAGIDYSYTLKADPRFLDWATWVLSIGYRHIAYVYSFKQQGEIDFMTTHWSFSNACASDGSSIANSVRLFVNWTWRHSTV